MSSLQSFINKEAVYNENLIVLSQSSFYHDFHEAD